MAAVASSRGARAEPVFGEAGTLALSAERLFGYVHTSLTVAQNGGGDRTSTADTITLFSNPSALFATGYSWPRLALDVFVRDNVSLGGAISFFNISPFTGSISGFSLAPRIGYAAVLGPRVRIWPRAGITYERATNDLGANTTQNLVALTIEAPLAILVAPRVVFLIGPTLDLGIAGSVSSGGISSDEKLTDFGVQAGLLVYF